MELDHLRLIQALVADPNLTRTAERLHFTQSALSKRVQAIEGEVGVSLFERRGPRGLRPLPKAYELAQLAERIGSAWESGLKRLQRTPDEPTHFVLVGPPLFMREVLLPWWEKTAPGFPRLHLEVQVSPLERVSLETVRAGADAGILEHRDELADFVCRHIYTEQWGIVRYPESRRRKLGDQLWGTHSTQRNPVDTWLVQRQKMPAPSYRLYWEDLTALANWISRTPGAASVLPHHAVRALEKEGRIDFEPLGPEASSRLYLAYPKNSPHQQLLKELSKLGGSQD